MKKTIKLIGVDGSVKVLSSDALGAMQQAVGGYVEVVRHMPVPGVLLVNEEGWVHNLPVNMTASAMAGQPIAGNAVYIRGGDSW